MKIGVVVPMDADPSVGSLVRYRETRAFAQQAEEAGFDSIWIYDHLLFRFPEKPTTGVWEAWTIMTALAEATTRVEIGSIVLCTPFRNPAVLAKMAITLDEISDGRLILGLGAGWHQPEFDAFGISFDAKVARFEEALQIIVPLLREGRVSFEGQHYSAVDCEIVPRGPRPAGPPVLIASKQPRMLRLTARYGDSWNTAWFGEVSGIAERRADIEAACVAEGRDPATLEITVGVIVAQDEGFEGPALKGTPEEIASGLRGYAEAGVGHVICNLEPSTPKALSHLANALKLYQQATS